MTPAIVVAAVFVAACAVFAVAFVSARGGLEMPLAASPPPVAVASGEPTSPLPTPPPETPAPTAEPTQPVVSAPPTVAPPTVAPPPPSSAPSAAPNVVPTLAPGDPLLALPGCPEQPACFEYTIVRGDTLSGIISRYRLDIDVLQALNPGRLSNPSLIVVGHVLYVGRSPFARLAPCPNGEACVVYVVQPGDTLSQIAGRYLLTTAAILAENPGLPRPIRPAQEIKLPV